VVTWMSWSGAQIEKNINYVGLILTPRHIKH
jgi:hypothetical protein